MKTRYKYAAIGVIIFGFYVSFIHLDDKFVKQLIAGVLIAVSFMVVLKWCED